ncbi:hypothetical protein [Nocardia acidivorans]|uniref:hypothetical protein n=1 Tax=Nocardia acidivorans TaxID=404580 RepID=UPI000831DD3E|nr:hypothetical protein [Nocardia acidivorans]
MARTESSGPRSFPAFRCAAAAESRIVDAATAATSSGRRSTACPHLIGRDPAPGANSVRTAAMAAPASTADLTAGRRALAALTDHHHD